MIMVVMKMFWLFGMHIDQLKFCCYPFLSYVSVYNKLTSGDVCVWYEWLAEVSYISYIYCNIYVMSIRIILCMSCGFSKLFQERVQHGPVMNERSSVTVQVYLFKSLCKICTWHQLFSKYTYAIPSSYKYSYYRWCKICKLFETYCIPRTKYVWGILWYSRHYATSAATSHDNLKNSYRIATTVKPVFKVHLYIREKVSGVPSSQVP